MLATFNTSYDFIAVHTATPSWFLKSAPILLFLSFIALLAAPFVWWMQFENDFFIGSGLSYTVCFAFTAINMLIWLLSVVRRVAKARATFIH